MIKYFTPCRLGVHPLIPGESSEERRVRLARESAQRRRPQCQCGYPLSYHHECLECKAVFHGGSTAKWCSDECRRKAQNAREREYNAKYPEKKALKQKRWQERHPDYKPPRKPKIVKVRTCTVCSNVIDGRGKYCVECKRNRKIEYNKRQLDLYRTRRRPREFKCLVCRSKFHDKGTKLDPSRKRNRKYCSNKCCTKANRKTSAMQRRMKEKARRKKICAGERIRPYDIFARDGFKCQLCRRKVKIDKKVPHPLSPTIDHIVPLANGGEHIATNVQTAHFICNVKRSNVGKAQLLMFG